MKRYLSVKQIAERTGQPYETIRSLAGRKISKGAGDFPLPACVVGELGGRSATYGWDDREIDDWYAGYALNKPHARSKMIE
ncbi:hypothetical protein DK926_19015 [Rhodococcus sp. Eu-32]|uniref:helix-turn-helix transcriptional regulator n=1 Tax=Rhodococcus sp. Eu-32 TaxID=1017319 RepID=UPI000DF4679D|nr:hypothetical protein [Rhodococcus sp. Eu-32]RRQ26334.1 hypothetical protein DK926_19015 [Rhodococcus sp. Eu-32]